MIDVRPGSVRRPRKPRLLHGSKTRHSRQGLAFPRRRDGHSCMAKGTLYVGVTSPTVNLIATRVFGYNLVQPVGNDGQ